MFKKPFIIIILIFISPLYSQNHVDALRYSLFDNYNTAGISSLGGAGGLLTPNHNPSSLGFFSGDQLFSISLINNSQAIETHYLDGHNLIEQPFNLGPSIQNIGYAKSYDLGKNNEHGWTKINVSVSYNRKMNFNKEMVISGYNEQSSMSNMFLQNSQGLYPDELNPFSDYLAFQTYLTDTVNSENYYETWINSNGQNQSMTIYEDGYINEVDFAIAGSYKDFLCFGMSIGVTEIQYNQTSSYKEDDFEPVDLNSSDPSFILHMVENFEYNQYLDVSGEGINFKFGLFIKPLSFLRLGWAYHSKTHTSLSEVYETYMQTSFINDDRFEAFSPTNFFNYELITPAKSIQSLAIIKSFNKLNCLLTIDHETIDYGSSNLSSLSYNFIDENNNIVNLYERTTNKKIGLLLSLNNISIKSGYAIFGSPFQDNINDGERSFLTGGIGFKTGAYSFDLSITHWTKHEDHILYQDMTLVNPDQIANTHHQGSTIILTCNYKF